eukprot:TRINITY_DN14846_c0_g1_i1.p1 TRINITY_DN14846_c0_g1~~TRINITY_DN14846_c0_g1_i1.p1  ORF type:complete len:256 (+),score=49.74 TRINITY_DN14846_c0_g1_i1:110-769(+)
MTMSMQVAQAQMQALQAMQAGYAGAMYPPPYPQVGGFPGGKGRGKGKGKGKSSGYKGSRDEDSSDPRRQIAAAQRRAANREGCAIADAQRAAQQRFEKDILDRLEGKWVDEADSSIAYEVQECYVTVSGGGNGRTFRNRLGAYGVDLCWDAKRFWHNLNMTALPPKGETVERVEWNPAEGSPPTKQIVWVKAPPEAESREPEVEASEVNDDDKAATTAE